MNKRKYIAVLVLYLIASVCSGNELAATDEQEYVTRYMARFFPRQHLSQLPLDDSISERVWNNYINALDYERIFFLKSDVDRFRKEIHEIDDDMKDGDLGFAFRIYDVFKKRLANRCEYVTELVERDWDFEKDESYVWKRRDAPWPADEKEWNEIWRKRIKNEFLRRKVGDILKDEEAEKAEETKEPEEAVKPEEAESVSTNVQEQAESNTAPPPTVEESILKRYERLQTIIDDNDADYVVQRFLTAFANAYDPHSSYLSPTSLDDFDIEMKLSLVGIGALLQADDGTAKVVRLIPGGPASRDKRDNRLREGDKIIGVGQGDDDIVDVLHWPLNKIVQKIRGEKGTIVVLQVVPASDPSGSTTKNVDLVRDEVKLEEQAVQWTLHEVDEGEAKSRKLAVIDVPAFYANLRAKKGDSDYRSSADDVRKALREIATNGVEGVVLDLRNNGGGSLVDAVRMTGLFIPSGPAVQVKEASSRGRVLQDDDPAVVYDGPLLVMVNRLSASASEILAAALQDYGRAVVVGDSRTHGKGTVQTVVNVGRNPQFGAIKLTTAVFYRITGDSTQLRGVIPDIYIPSPYDYMDLGEDSLKYPVEWTRTNRCRYRRYGTTGDLEELRGRSQMRRKESEEFKLYSQLLEQIEKIYESDTLPLNIDARLKQSRTEKEIIDLQRELAEKDTDADQDKDEKKDLILQESLQILSDMVVLQPLVEGTESENASAFPDDTLAEKIKDWLRNKE